MTFMTFMRELESEFIQNWDLMCMKNDNGARGGFATLNGGKNYNPPRSRLKPHRTYFRENERLFGIPVEKLLMVEGKIRKPWEVYRKV